MRRSKAIGTTVLALFTLISCGAPEDWFPCHHEVTFRRGGATAPESVVPADARSLVMFQVQTKVKAHAEAVTIDGLTFRASGTGDDREDIAGVSLHVDRNGDGALDGGDRLLARVKRFLNDNGKVRFGRLDLEVDHNRSKSLLLVYDLSGTASPGETFRVRLAEEGDVDAETTDAGWPVVVEGVPVRSPVRIVGDPAAGVVRLALGSETPPARFVDPGRTGLEMLQIAIQKEGPGDVCLETISFHGTGTADEQEDILQAYLYRDADGNGLLDPKRDSLVATAGHPEDDSPVTFSGLGVILPPDRAIHFLLVYDLAGTASPGEWFQATILWDTDVVVTSSTRRDPLPVLGLPLHGEVAMIPRPRGS